MPNLKRLILASLAILTVLVAVACGASSPTATPTPEATLTPENTPLPTATPTLEVAHRPQLPLPVMEGSIDVGGGRLNYQCFGEGSPTVIVEAGGGDKPIHSLSWNAVVLGVYATTRICIYDRVDVRTSQDVAENLHILLRTIPVPGPYVLVAHSVGGWHARVFAYLYPDEVVGMILVDTTPMYPDAMFAFATAYPTYSAEEVPGITQGRLSEADIYTIKPPSMDGLDNEASAEQVRQAGSLGDIPLVVISQKVGGPDDWPGLDPVARQQYAELTQNIQADLATLSSNGVFMVAHTSNHFISEYEPEIIIDAILQMVEQIRNK